MSYWYAQCTQNKLTEIRKHGLRMELMNGGNTNQPDDPNSINNANNGIPDRYTSNNAAERGRHESEEWYYLCEQRSQNYGTYYIYYPLFRIFVFLVSRV